MSSSFLTAFTILAVALQAFEAVESQMGTHEVRYSHIIDPKHRHVLESIPHVDTATFAPIVKAQIAEAESKARAHPNDARLVGGFGMVLQTYSQYQAAAAAYSRALVLEPGKFEWAYLLGKVELEQGRFDWAAASLRSALKLDPSNVPAQLSLAECLVATADWDEAGRLYRDILNRQPNCAQAWYGLGRVQAAKADHVAATVSFSKACDLYPQYGTAHFALAGELRKSGRAAEAAAQMEAYSKNRNLEPPLEDPLAAQVRQLNRSSTVHFERSAGLEAAGKLDEAVQEHQAILQQDPKNVQAHVNLISLYGRLGDAVQAKQHFEEAVKLDPARSDAWYNYGVLLFSQHQNTEAEKAFGSALQINPKYAEAHNNLGAVYEQENRLEDAAREFRAAIADRPNYPLARFHLARLLVNQQKYDEAIEQLRRALQPEEENTAVYTYALAAAYARAGNREQALHYYREAHDRAAAHGQSQILASIDREMRELDAQR